MKNRTTQDMQHTMSIHGRKKTKLKSDTTQDRNSKVTCCLIYFSSLCAVKYSTKVVCSAKGISLTRVAGWSSKVRQRYWHAETQLVHKPIQVGSG